MKTKMQVTNRGDSMFEVYDRMTNQINLELGKLATEFEVII